MQKIFLPLLFIMMFVTKSKAQKRLFDQIVQLKSFHISIEADPFIATTTIEIEFYNTKDKEVEGRQDFHLNRGQVITDFQLELNGKYREGSIEERWKARQAYSSIVGKRVDPALLQMNGTNDYYINVYPIAAKSSRKVKFTITQMMTAEDLKLSYLFPLNFKSVTEEFKIDIKVNKPSTIPYANGGLLGNQLFNMDNEGATLSWQAKSISLDQPVSFSINQFTNQPQFCINKQNGKTNFLMRLYPNVDRYYQRKPRIINVYWDVSLSGKNRDLRKELDFLESYISVNGINKTNIILFNQQLQGVIVFDQTKDNFNSIKNYLLTYKYSGATELGNLNFSNVLADAVLLFSDGINSMGNAQPKLGAVQVNFVTSMHYYYYNNNYDKYKSIIGNTEGSIIDLDKTEIKDAVKKIDSAENFLFKYTAENIHINESFPVKLGNTILLSGTLDKADNLELFYGNNNSTFKSENYFLPDDVVCDKTTYKKMQMLKAYDSLLYGNYWSWQNMIVFGLTERVVTPQTSFLVLERIEDYIKYKIAPPKELEEKCAELNYVYKTEYKIKALKEFTEQDALDIVIKDYNKRITWWDKKQELIDINKPVPYQQNTDLAAAPDAGSTNSAGSSSGVQTNFSTGGTDLKEVVVTSAFGIKRTARSSSANVQYINSEQLNIVRSDNINNALAGKVAGIQVRSQSVGLLGAESTIRLRGENGFGVGRGPVYVVDGTIMPSIADINVDDVQDVTVLQGPAAAALFGPDGSNGAIVINIKKGRRNYPYYYYQYPSEYKLSSAEDEDYIRDMQRAGNYELWEKFLELEKENENNVGFYFDMADFFFNKGLEDKAKELMFNAIELCGGSSYGLKIAAYMYEQWGCFDKALAVYKGILSVNENDLQVKRDLALAYFQNKNYEQAVKTYYGIITAAVDDNHNIKEIALAEMNAILATCKNKIDISYINFNLIRQLPVDLRITMESNYGYMYNPQILEPDNSICNWKNLETKNGGRFSGKPYYLYYNNEMTEYINKNAAAGSYRVKIDTYNSGSYNGRVPNLIRVITFRNFQKENMTMEIKLFNLDNQYGTIELDAVNW